MVDEGKRNEEIYSYIRENYGNHQIAVPRQGWFNRISYGLPFLLIGIISVIVLGYAWNWSQDESASDAGPDDQGGADDSKREKIEELASEGGPLH
jgi:cytochrome c-type biogenesis protein CcmH/NrfF